MKNIEPKQGELYRDNKENVYQIVAVAKYVEQSKKVVVYQEMFAPYEIVAMTLESFVQKFTPVNTGFVESTEVQAEIGMNESKEEEPLLSEDSSYDYPEGVNPLLIDFLEADTIHEKVKLLIDNRTKVDDKCINDLAASLDISIEEGDIDMRYYQLVSCLETMRKYEILR